MKQPSRKLLITISLPDVGALLIVVPVAAYLLFGVYRIATPGLQYDESLFINAALGNLDGSFVAYKTELFGHEIVLMCMPYIGALKSWLWAPVFSLFGVSALTIRLPAILIGAVAIVFTFLYLRRMFDRYVAALAILLLALDPSFIFEMRFDFGPVALMMLFKAGVLYTGFRAWTESDRRLALAAGLLMGLGIFDKSNFGWLPIALLCSLLVCYPRELLAKLRSLGPAAAVGLFIGVIPLAIFNVAVPFGTLAGQFTKHVGFFDALGQRLGVLHSVLDGRAMMDLVSSGQIGGQGHSYAAPETALWDGFLAALLGLLGLIVYERRVDRRIMFLVTLLASIFLLIILTPNAYGPHHAQFTYPFPHIMIAYVIVRVTYIARLRFRGAQRLVLGAVAVAIAFLVFGEVVTDSAYIGNFVATGGAGAWSDKIYALERMLPKDRRHRVAFMDWGFDTQLNGLSHDRIVHDEDFWNLSQPSVQKPDEQIARLIERNKIFVFHSPLFATFPLVRQRFDDYLIRHHVRETVEQVKQEDGVPVYEVITLNGKAIATRGAVQGASAVTLPPAVTKSAVTFSADPIDFASGQEVGVTTLHWSTGYKNVSIFVGQKDGTLFTTQNGVGSAQTGPWVTDGMEFFLERERSPGDSKSLVTIATVRAHSGG